jgi:hypothetical protein
VRTLPQRASVSIASRVGYLIIVIGVATFALSLATVTKADTDLWGHTKFGRDMLASRTLPRIDPYSFNQDHAWIDHEWLSELQMGVAYRVGGTSGLALLKGALVCAALLIIWRALHGTDFVARLAVIAGASLGTLPMILKLRPQLWSFLCLAWLCRILSNTESRVLYGLPLLFAVWANLHGGFVLGLGVLVAWSAADSLQTPNHLRGWVIVVTACTLSTLLTPYGWTLWRFLAATVRMTRTDITEWRPLWSTSIVPWLLWLVGVSLSIWVVIDRRPGWIQSVASLALLAVLALRVVRIGPFFVVAAVLFAAPAIRHRYPAAPRHVEDMTVPTQIAFATCAFLVLVTSSIVVGARSLRCIAIEGAWAPDLAAARALDTALPGRLFTSFNWGEFAIWHWGPRLQVAMDGRRETVYSEARIQEYRNVMSATPAGLSLLTAWSPHYTWLPAVNSDLRDWLAAHGYRIEVKTTRSFIAVRADLAPLNVDSATSTISSGCFPR